MKHLLRYQGGKTPLFRWYVPLVVVVSTVLFAPLLVSEPTVSYAQVPTATFTPKTTAPASITPTVTLIFTATPSPEACAPDAEVVEDIILSEGGTYSPNTEFIKTWRVRNSGNCVWDKAYTISLVDGETMGAETSAVLPKTGPGEITKISIGMVAPAAPGEHRGVWRLRAPSGEFFGKELTVTINVTEPGAASISEPPAMSSPTAPSTLEPTPVPGTSETELGGILRPLGLGLLAVALLGGVGIGILYLREQGPFAKRSGTPPPPAPTEAPTHEASALDEIPTPPTLVSTTPPQEGMPYLASQTRPAGAVYCSLRQPSITIGRAPDNDLVIDEHFTNWQTVSHEHARIERDGQDIVVVDLDSTNGVYVNGQRTHENLLRDGDRVSFGQVQFTFHMNREGRPV